MDFNSTWNRYSSKKMIVLKSKYCLTPNNCVPIETEIPLWIMLIILGSAVLIIKEVSK